MLVDMFLPTKDWQKTRTKLLAFEIVILQTNQKLQQVEFKM